MESEKMQSQINKSKSIENPTECNDYHLKIEFLIKANKPLDHINLMNLSTVEISKDNKFLFGALGWDCPELMSHIIENVINYIAYMKKFRGQFYNIEFSPKILHLITPIIKGKTNG